MTTNEKEAALHLRTAAQQIEAALIRLDMRHQQCRCCGSTRHENKIHMQAYNRITDTPQKLREVADQLEGR
jgi:hypothetical protein